jgi:trehalose synthase
MLEQIKLENRSLEVYEDLVPKRLINEIIGLSKKLSGKRVLYINSTFSRGGVAELLRNLVPLMQNLGIKAEWKSINILPSDFYKITKFIHNGLQGDKQNITSADWHRYEEFNRSISKEINQDEWDYIFVQDHQLTASLSYLKKSAKTKWIWRSHTDTEQPNPNYVKQFLKYLQPYDGAQFHIKNFIFKNYHPEKLMVSPVAIDPFSDKNLPMEKTIAKEIVASYGINTNEPLITQVSRFDPWKDHIGVINSWLIAKKKIPSLQLAFMGILSEHDKQAQQIYQRVLETLKDLDDVYIILNQYGKQVKAFNVWSNVCIQKSIREGFGLTVCEALWSNTPVIGGNVGGIKIQIFNGKNGYLVDNAQACSEKIVQLVNDPLGAGKMGEYGHYHVGKQFLLPRLLRDELKIMSELTN